MLKKENRKYLWSLVLFLLLFPLFKGCAREVDVHKYPVIYDLARNFHLADVYQEVRLIKFGTPAARQYMRTGWSIDEKGSSNIPFVWATGTSSLLEVYFSVPREISLRFRCSPFTFPNSPPQKITIRLNERVLGSIKLDRGAKEYQFVLRRDAMVQGTNKLEFRYHYAYAPKDVVPGVKDTRELAVSWDYIIFGSEGDELLPESWADAESGVLYIPFGAQVDFFVNLRDKGLFTTDGIILTGDAPGSLQFSLQAEGNKEQILKTFQASTSLETIPLQPTLNQGVLLSLRAVPAHHSAKDSDGVVIVRPAIRLKELPEEVLTEASAIHSQSRAGLRRPNIIIYLMDALRADHLGCYGYELPVSPNIDAFVQDSILFENAVAQASWTRPATASILTGLGPWEHGVNDIDDGLSKEAITLAEILRAAGYSTAGFIANKHVGTEFGFDQGFVNFFDLAQVPINAVQAHEEHAARMSHPLTDTIHEQVFSWLDEEGDREPFFFYIHTMDIHEPYRPDPIYRRKFAPQVNNPDVGSSQWLRQLTNGKIPLTDSLVRDMVSLYDAEVASNDYRFGLLIKELKRRGLYKQSLIILVSDHGEAFFEHEKFGHRNSLYSEVLRIPLLVKLPKKDRDNVIQSNKELQLVQQIDILPTLLDYIGLDVPHYLPGGNFLNSSSVGSELPRLTFAYHRGRMREIESIIERPWHLIRERREGQEDATVELYHLEQDPLEKVNLIAQHPQLAEHLISLLEEHKNKGGLRLEPEKTLIDKELQERLKALGYVQ